MQQYNESGNCGKKVWKCGRGLEGYLCVRIREYWRQLEKFGISEESGNCDIGGESGPRNCGIFGGESGNCGIGSESGNYGIGGEPVLNAGTFGKSADADTDLESGNGCIGGKSGNAGTGVVSGDGSIGGVSGNGGIGVNGCQGMVALRAGQEIVLGFLAELTFFVLEISGPDN